MAKNFDELAAKRDWEQSAEFRAEFDNDLKVFLAYKAAIAAKLVKFSASSNRR